MTAKIVIVDDEPHIRLLLEQILEELYDDQPLEIFSAADSTEALTVIRQEKPQLVFLDILIAITDDFEVCAAVKSDPSLSCVTIILVTDQDQEADRECGLKAGATKYVTKPFDLDEISSLTKLYMTYA